ncbi:hypothetical protein MTO96_019183 [Rhipicephalus appendiculatus]
MNLDDRNRLTEFSRNFSESSMYASYVTAWNRVVLCYEGYGPQGGSWSMDRQLTAIRNFFRRLFGRNKDVAAGQNADNAESATGGAANHANAASKHDDEQLGDHKDPSDDYDNQVARPTQLKSPFTHSLKCGQF